jgi:hypothetical protein
MPPPEQDVIDRAQLRLIGLLREQAPALVDAALDTILSLRLDLDRAMDDARHLAFGRGWDHGFHAGEMRGWSERDKTAETELAAKNLQIKTLEARGQRGPVSVEDVDQWIAEEAGGKPPHTH